MVSGPSSCELHLIAMLRPGQAVDTAGNTEKEGQVDRRSTFVKKHSEKGAEMLSGSRYSGLTACVLVSEHHERWMGRAIRKALPAIRSIHGQGSSQWPTRLML